MKIMEKKNYLPFRKFSLKHTDKVFCVSEMGKEYLSNLYPKYRNKVFSSHLGTLDYGMGPVSNSDEFSLVSCGNLVRVKQPWLIVDILRHIDFKLHWTHVGDGPLLNEMLEACKQLPKNITYSFKGRLDATEVIELYKSTAFDCFINVSISEGLPVSIMEAVSFGIPVIATDVGGTSEIVINHKTGHLIPLNFISKDVAAYIKTIRNDFHDKRSAIKEFWKNNFSAITNYQKFAKELNL